MIYATHLNFNNTRAPIHLNCYVFVYKRKYKRNVSQKEEKKDSIVKVLKFDFNNNENYLNKNNLFVKNENLFDSKKPLSNKNSSNSKNISNENEKVKINIKLNFDNTDDLIKEGIFDTKYNTCTNKKIYLHL